MICILKLVNKIRLAIDVWTRSLKPKSYPYRITFSLTNQCDRRCPICSINKLAAAGLPRAVNAISLDELKAFSVLL